MLLNYAASYPNTVIHYKSRNMILHVDSDAACLTIPETRSCYTGHLYVIDWPLPHLLKSTPKINGPINIEYMIIRNEVSSTEHAETFSTINNGKAAIGIRSALI